MSQTIVGRMMQAVVGLGFGDEGKGLITSVLCANTNNPLVVRYNGGHQAGHTVHHNGVRHVFSNFGSGTLQNVPTYWSKYCTLSPIGFLNEYAILREKGIIPTLFVHPECPITTPFDIAYNGMDHENGSVGVGFGLTVERELNHYHLQVRDMHFPCVLGAKLAAVQSYYYRKVAEKRGFTIANEFLEKFDVPKFIEQMLAVKELISVQEDDVMNHYNVIMEGAQGIMLDQHHGFFPNVTRSNTTLQNAVELGFVGEINYVTRAYQTRHGKGFMSSNFPIKLIDNENETNTKPSFQGAFRTAVLDIDLLNYALECNSKYHATNTLNLYITCLDQVPHPIPVLINNKYYCWSVEEICGALNTRMSHVYTSWSDDGTKIREEY